MSEALSPSEVTGADLELADPRALSVCRDQSKSAQLLLMLRCIVLYDKSHQSWGVRLRLIP